MTTLEGHVDGARRRDRVMRLSAHDLLVLDAGLVLVALLAVAVGLLGAVL